MTTQAELLENFDSDKEFLTNILPWKFVSGDSHSYVGVYRYDSSIIEVNFGWMICIDGDVRTAYQVSFSVMKEAEKCFEFSNNYETIYALMLFSQKYRRENPV